jgi:Domain of unknown function (DUF4352)
MRLTSASTFTAVALAASCAASSLGACRRFHHKRTAPAASASAVASAGASDAGPPDGELPEEPAPPTSSAVHQLGEKVSAPDFRMVVKAVKECKARHYYRPKASDMWLGVQLYVEGTSAHEVRVDRFDTTLEDGAGHVYRPTLDTCEPGLPNARLTQGDHAHGWITFEVPRAASGLVFQFDALVIGAGHEGVRFAVLR